MAVSAQAETVEDTLKCVYGIAGLVEFGDDNRNGVHFREDIRTR